MAHTSHSMMAGLIEDHHPESSNPTGGVGQKEMHSRLCNIYDQMLTEKERRDEATDIFGDTSSITVPVEDPAYAKLRHVLGEAYDQAAVGKGRDRHVKREDQPFEHQPICSLQRIYGSGYAFGQVGKKMEESMRMDTKAAVAELYGAINYIAAAIIVLEEGE